MGKDDKQTPDAKEQRFDQSYWTSSSLYQTPVMAQDNTRTNLSANVLAQRQVLANAGKPPPTPHLTGAQKVALIVGELALIMARLHCELNPFNPMNWFNDHSVGDFWGEINLGELMMVMKLVAPPDKFAEMTKNLVLDAATYKSNRVYIDGNIFDERIAVSSPRLHVGGIKTDKFTSGVADLKGFSASLNYAKGTAQLNVLQASLDQAQLIKGDDRIAVDHVGLMGLHIDGGKNGSFISGALNFVSADMTRLRYPGMPPVSMQIGGGTSFAAVWQQMPKQELPAGTTAPAAAVPAPATGSKAPATTSKAPAKPTMASMLPADAEVKITLNGTHAAGLYAGMFGGLGGANAGFDLAKVALVSGGAELASITVNGFAALGGGIGPSGPGGGGAAAGMMTIDKIELRGEPAFVQTLLVSPIMQPDVAPAIAAVRRLGIQPAIGGSVTLEHLRVGAAVIGATPLQASGSLHGDFATHVVVPKLGSLDVNLRNFDLAGGTHGGLASTNTSFESFSAVLRGDGGAELARLELAGGGVQTGKQTAGTLKTLKATGDVNGILRALKEPLKTAPASVRGAIAAVRALGVGFAVTGSGLSATEDSKGNVSYAGNLHTSVATTVGRVELEATGVRGTGAQLTALARFKLTLHAPGGGVAASILATGMKANAAFKKKDAGMHADHFEVHGDYAQVSAMMGAVSKKIPELPPPLRHALAVVDQLDLHGALAVAVDDVNVTENKAHQVSARVGAINSTIDLPGVGKVALAMRGVRGSIGRGGEGGVDHFELKLLTKTKGQALRVACDGAVSDGTAKGDDFSIGVKNFVIEGNAGNAAAMVAGARAHYQLMGGPALHTLEAIEKYMRVFDGDVGIAVTNSKMSSIDGVVRGQGNVSTTVTLPTGKVAMKLGGVDIAGESYRFDTFSLIVTDATGGVAASMVSRDGQVCDDPTSNAVTGSAGRLEVTGDAARIRSLFSPEIRALLPAGMIKAFDSLDDSKVNLALDGAFVESGAGNGTNLGLQAMHLTANVRLVGKDGIVYRVDGADITIKGAQAKLGPDGQPTEITSGGLLVRGKLTTSEGLELSGGVLLSTGPARVEMANGQPTCVEVSDFKLSAAATLRDPVAKDPATTSTVAPATATLPITSTGTGTTPTTVAPTPTTTTAPAPTTTAPTTATGTPQPSIKDMASAGAALVQELELHSHTPVQAGRYGRGFLHIDVPEGAAISINLVVRKHAIDPKATGVEIRPQFHFPLGVRIGGAHLKQKGDGAVLRFDLGGLVGKIASGVANLINVTSMLPINGKTLPLDLTALIDQVMGDMKSEVATAQQNGGATATSPATTTTPTPPPATGTGPAPTPATTTAPTGDDKAAKKKADDDAWLASEHAKWANGAARHAEVRNDRRRERLRQEDVREEPRSADVLALFTEGVQLTKTTGTVDVGLDGMTQFGGGDFRLHGDVNGKGQAELAFMASSLSANIAGNQVDAQGLSASGITASRQGDVTQLAIEGLSIDHAVWQVSK